MKNLVQKLALAAALSIPLSCGVSQSSAPSSISSDTSAIKTSAFRSAAQLFNFAHYVSEQPALSKLLPYVGPGQAYLFFGEKDKFRVESNLTVDANGGLTDTGSRYVRSNYYLDGYIFGRQLTEGSLVEMEAKANFNSSTVTALVRFLGDDKYNGSIKVGIDKTFIRDISYDKVIYGMPMLGVSVSATLGGELGMRAAPGLRADHAISASFEPRIHLSGSGVASLTALSFLSARAEGAVEILDLKLSSTASVGALLKSDFIYANMGLDGAKIMALDGKIDLFAEADIGGRLPNGVNALLWSLVGINPNGMQWHHTLWDPAPVYVTTLNRYGATVIDFLKEPASAAACLAATSDVQDQLAQRLVALEAESTETDEYAELIVQSNVDGMKEVISKVKTYCADPSESSFASMPVAVAGRAPTLKPSAPLPTPTIDNTSDEDGDNSIWGSDILDPW